MDGPVNEHQVGILALEPLDCPGTSMRRTVVDDPENPSRPAIGMLLHDLIDQAIKGGRFRFWLRSDRRVWLGGRPGRPDRPKLPAARIHARLSSADRVVQVKRPPFGSAPEYWFSRRPRERTRL